ncbi:MAG: serine/threonine protein kinase [Polyangiaceae bacterium]|nr:serine/threonine protein kinase [Polyangiaceae bacterium]MCL4753937.1 serine/threonine protein kinase [Myxococcales bacterium]
MTDTPSVEPIRIVGRYALHQEIAAGGMATVHLGRLLGPAGFSRTVAIKKLHPQFAKDPEFVSMFLDEARVAARIRHPNVVSTLDVVALDGELFIVMDYVEGESLARLVRAARGKGGWIPIKNSISLVTNVLYGLHGAHEAKGERGEPLGIVHRDISPQNILVDTDGTARVVDFGVAKAVGRLQTTRDGQLKGKLSYMAPEQLKGEAVDRRTDVFAASIVLWELLTGKRLFQSDNEAATFGKVLNAEVPVPSSIEPSVSAELDAILLKGLAKNMDDRFASALDMAEELERAARDRPTQRELGRWVRELAAESLARRADQVRELESHSAVSDLVGAPDPHSISSPRIEVPPMPAPVLAPAEAVPAVLPVPREEQSGNSNLSSISMTRGRTLPPPLNTRKNLMIALGGVAGVLGFLVILIGFLVLRRATQPADAGASGVEPIPGAAPAVEPTLETPAPEVASAAPPSEPAPSEPKPEAPKPEPAKPEPAKPEPAKLTEKKPAEKKPVEAKAPTGVKPVAPKGCNPPYTLDKDGTRIPKPECL